MPEEKIVREPGEIPEANGEKKDRDRDIHRPAPGRARAAKTLRGRLATATDDTARKAVNLAHGNGRERKADEGGRKPIGKRQHRFAEADE